MAIGNDISLFPAAKTYCLGLYMGHPFQLDRIPTMKVVIDVSTLV